MPRHVTNGMALIAGMQTDLFHRLAKHCASPSWSANSEPSMRGSAEGGDLPVGGGRCAAQARHSVRRLGA